MKEITPGTLAIFTMSDEPSARMVAVVTKVTKRKIWGRYLSDYPKKHCDPWVAGEGKEQRCTPVSAFGVDVEIDMDLEMITCRKSRPSEATYEDGTWRRWQGADFDAGFFREPKHKRWARWALNQQIVAENVRETGQQIKERVAARRAA